MSSHDHFTPPCVYHPDFVTPLPPGHRFPMGKFGKVYEVLVRDGVIPLHQFHCPEPADRAALTLVHDPGYVDAYLTGRLDSRAMRRIGFPWSPALVTRTCAAVGGTILAARLALSHGVACSTAGGTHHAHRDWGSGYCIFNDLAVAARWVQREGLARRVLILDLDVHQGDGTATIFAGDPTVFTFSMHCAKNFPFRKPPSDLDAPLPVAADDDAYLAALAQHLPRALDAFEPDLVLYDAGVDPHREDRLGKLALTDAGLYRRDVTVLEMCRARGVPVATVVGGGYDEDLEKLGRRHTTVHRAAVAVFSDAASA